MAPSLVIRVDAKKYDAVQDRLTQIFKCLAKQDGSVPVTNPALPAGWQPEAKQILRREFLGVADQGPDALAKLDADFGLVRALVMKKVEALTDPRTAVPEQKPVVVKRSRSSYGRYKRPVQATAVRKPVSDRQREHASLEDDAGTVVLIYGQSGWKWFKLEDRIELPSLRTTVAVRFRDNEGSQIKAANLTLGPWVPGLATPPGNGTNGVPRTVFISPSFLYYSGEGYHIPGIIVAKSLTVHGQTTLENDQLARTKNVDIAVQ